jgi:hypothetical protein
MLTRCIECKEPYVHPVTGELNWFCIIANTILGVIILGAAGIFLGAIVP